MKKKIIFFLIFIFAAVVVLRYAEFDFPAITGALTSSPTTSLVQDEGNISLYFCPEEDCEGALVQFLDSAQQSIHCALFEIDLESIQQKLLEKAAVMDVKVVTDNDYLKQFNHSFVRADKYGLMHNKFCIIDGNKISTGSMNPTHNDAHRNNNNLLLINSAVLASNYDDEFWEMWNGEFKKGSSVLNPSLMLGNMSISNYFCPEDHCAEQIQKELRKAKESIYFMAFSFTNEGLANVLLLKHQEGIPIHGVMEARQVSKYSKFMVLEYQGIDVIKDKNPGNMHHKVFIIDRETVVTGSFNPTEGGDKRNDENILIIKDRAIAQKFLEEFERVYSQEKP